MPLQPRMTPKSQRRAERLSRRVTAVGSVLHGLTPQRCQEIVRRDAESAEIDGYGSGRRDGPGSRGAHSDPTLSAVGARADSHVTDPVHTTVTRIEMAVKDMVKLAREIRRLGQVLDHSADSLRGRVSSLQGTCTIEACAADVIGIGDDRLRRGWCPACYKAWLRWKITRDPPSDPGAERLAFVRYRTDQLSRGDAA